jgi:hypothetical protein
MKSLLNTITVLFLVFFLRVTVSLAEEEQAPLSEDLKITDLSDTKKDDPYSRVEDGLIVKIDSFLKELESFPPPPSLREAELLHLTGVYYVCSLKRGTCPVILNAILELDFLENVKTESKAGKCNRMKGFWSQWIKNQFEKRQGYELDTGRIKLKQEFDRLERPKYLKCSQTLSERLEINKSSYPVYLKQLSQNRDMPLKSLLLILQETKKTIPNVFVYSKN